MKNADVKRIRDAAIEAGTHVEVTFETVNGWQRFNLPTVLTVARMLDVIRANVDYVSIQIEMRVTHVEGRLW